VNMHGLGVNFGVEGLFVGNELGLKGLSLSLYRLRSLIRVHGVCDGVNDTLFVPSWQIQCNAIQ
jgi:hypothetical protein